MSRRDKIVRGIAIGALPVLLLAAFLVWRQLEQRRAEQEIIARATRLAQEKQYAEQARELERLIVRFPGSAFREQALLDAGNVYNLYLRNAHKAIALYQQLLKEYPRSGFSLEVRRRLAESYYRDIGDLVLAAAEHKALKDALSDPVEIQAVCHTLGEIYLRRKELSRALHEYEEAAALKGDEHQQEKAWLKMGMIHQMQNKPAQAIPPFESVLHQSRCAECRYQAQVGLVDSYRAQDQYDKALQVLATMDGSPQARLFREREKSKIEEKKKLLLADSAMSWAGGKRSPKTAAPPAATKQQE